MDVPLFTTPPTVDLSSTEPPPTVGIVIAVVVIVVLIMLAAAVLVAIVVYYQYRKRLVSDIQVCTQFPQYSMCKHTRYMICIWFFFHCRNQPSKYDVDYTEDDNDVKLQKNPAYDTVQLSGCTSSSAPQYENVQLQTVQ